MRLDHQAVSQFKSKHNLDCQLQLVSNTDNKVPCDVCLFSMLATLNL